MNSKRRTVLPLAFCLLFTGQTGCNSCMSPFTNNAKIESYIGVSIPLDVALLKSMSRGEKQNLSLRKQKENGQGFAGARSPLGVIFLPIIAVMYLTLDEWWLATYTDPKGNKLTLRFQKGGKQSLIDGQIESPDGGIRQVAVLNLDQLKRRVLVEVGQKQPGKAMTATAIQKQVDLVGAYTTLLSGLTENNRRGRVIAEMLLVLQSEGVPLLSRLILDKEPDEAVAAGLDKLCHHGRRSDLDKEILDILGKAAVGPLVAAKALQCFEQQDDLKEASSFFRSVAKSICAGNPTGIKTLERFSCKYNADKKADVPLAESDLQSLCQDSPGATLVRMHLCFPTTDTQLEALLQSDFVDQAAPLLDPTDRAQWDMLLAIADKKPKIIYAMTSELHRVTFIPTPKQVALFFAPLLYAENEKGLFSRDGYDQQARLLDILLRAEPIALQQTEQTQARIAAALKTAEGEERTTLALLALLFHPKGSRRVEWSLLKAIPEKYARTQGESHSPNRNLMAALKGLNSKKPGEKPLTSTNVSIDSQPGLIYFALRRFGCAPTAITEAIRKKKALTCPLP